MEKTELFKRSIGEDTDIVEKEMYTFTDRGGDLVTLRPEATASIVRAYIQHKLYAPDPAQRLYMIGPMFRRERPQKGRYRQFYQIDAEIFGVASPLADAQLIFMLVTLFERLRAKNVEAHVNSLGCAGLPARLPRRAAGDARVGRRAALRGLPAAPRAKPAARAGLQGSRLPGGAGGRPLHPGLPVRGLPRGL